MTYFTWTGNLLPCPAPKSSFITFFLVREGKPTQPWTSKAEKQDLQAKKHKEMPLIFNKMI